VLPLVYLSSDPYKQDLNLLANDLKAKVPVFKLLLLTEPYSAALPPWLPKGPVFSCSKTPFV